MLKLILFLLISIPALADDLSLKRFEGNYRRADQNSECPLIFKLHYSPASLTYNHSDIVSLNATKRFPGSDWDGFGFVYFSYFGRGPTVEGDVSRVTTVNEMSISMVKQVARSYDQENLGTRSYLWSKTDSGARYVYIEMNASAVVTKKVECTYLRQAAL